jgi:hypothetical protein
MVGVLIFAVITGFTCPELAYEIAKHVVRERKIFFIEKGLHAIY